MPQWTPILTSSGTAKVLVIFLRKRRTFNGSRERKGEKWEKKKALVMRVMKSNKQRMGVLQPCIWPERLAPSCSLFRRITSELLQPFQRHTQRMDETVGIER